MDRFDNIHKALAARAKKKEEKAQVRSRHAQTVRLNNKAKVLKWKEIEMKQKEEEQMKDMECKRAQLALKEVEIKEKELELNQMEADLIAARINECEPSSSGTSINLSKYFYFL